MRVNRDFVIETFIQNVTTWLKYFEKTSLLSQEVLVLILKPLNMMGKKRFLII